MKAINLKAIRLDGGTQPRASINEQAVADYADAVNAGAKFPPLTVYFDGVDYWLADGFHRWHAHGRAGKASVECDVRTGTRRDAVLFSVGANGSHGLQRTNEDKRKAVETLLRDPEWTTWSNREIAKWCGVSDMMVGDRRQAMCKALADAAIADAAPPPPVAEVRRFERGGKVHTQVAQKRLSGVAKAKLVELDRVKSEAPDSLLVVQARVLLKSLRDTESLSEQEREVLGRLRTEIDEVLQLESA